MAKKPDRSDRFGSPEGADATKLALYDERGRRLDADAWVAKVKADAKKKKSGSAK